MRKKLLVAVPVALALVASTALWVGAAENEAIDRACADITFGEAGYQAPVEAIPGAPMAGVTPARFNFSMTTAAPTCTDVQYGLVVLAADPNGGAPVVLGSQIVPGDGVSNEIGFDLQSIAFDAEQEAVCAYVYTMGASGGTTTTPSSGNPHSQTLTVPGMEMFDRGPDGTGTDDYCNGVGEEQPGRSYD